MTSSIRHFALPDCLMHVTETCVFTMRPNRLSFQYNAQIHAVSNSVHLAAYFAQGVHATKLYDTKHTFNNPWTRFLWSPFCLLFVQPCTACILQPCEIHAQISVQDSHLFPVTELHYSWNESDVNAPQPQVPYSAYLCDFPFLLPRVVRHTVMTYVVPTCLENHGEKYWREDHLLSTSCNLVPISRPATCWNETS